MPTFRWLGVPADPAPVNVWPHHSRVGHEAFHAWVQSWEWASPHLIGAPRRLLLKGPHIQSYSRRPHPVPGVRAVPGQRSYCAVEDLTGLVASPQQSCCVRQRPRCGRLAHRPAPSGSHLGLPARRDPVHLLDGDPRRGGHTPMLVVPPPTLQPPRPGSGPTLPPARQVSMLRSIS